MKKTCFLVCCSCWFPGRKELKEGNTEVQVNRHLLVPCIENGVGELDVLAGQFAIVCASNTTTTVLTVLGQS